MADTSHVGLIATYFVADDAVARGLDVGSGPGAELDGLDGGVFMPDELAALAEHLGSSPPGYELIASTDEAWLVRLDDDLMALVASLPESITDELADERNLSLAEIELLEMVIRPLAGKAAATPGNGVYEWISL